MTNLRILAEGFTEVRFANEVLIPHLAGFGVYGSASMVVTSGRRGSKEGQGGGCTYLAWKKDITDWIKAEGHRSDFWFTSMLDLYGLAAFTDSFPGYDECRGLPDPNKKVAGLEEAWGNDIGFQHFIPHLQLHEFEALLLVDLSVLKLQFIKQSREIDTLIAEIHDAGKPPEQIDEGRETAPSKRIIHHLPQYGLRKAGAGSLAAGTIGLPRLRRDCPHFGAWLAKLESLGNA